MGLDMILTRTKKLNEKFELFVLGAASAVLAKRIRSSDPKVLEAVELYQQTNAPLFEEVGYWREANMIHHWFVEHVQGGNDDCEAYEVSKEQLEELLQTCNTVLNSMQTSTAVIDGEQIEIVVGSEKAEELLPTQSGLFFGSTACGERYVEDLQHTVKILTEVLATTDFDSELIAYNASW